MVKKISKRLAIFLAVLMVCGTLSVAQVETTKALSELAIQADKTVDVKDFEEFKKAVDEASENNQTIININSNIIFSSTITVKDKTNIIIQANSDKKLTQNSDRHFIVNGGGTLTLGSGIILDGGNSGGGIHNSRGTLNVTTNATIQNCKADIGGGILNDYYATATIGGKIISNSAEIGGGIYSYSSKTTITANGLVAGNSATKFDGGGIFNDIFSTLTVEQGSAVNENSAARYGGGIFSLESRASVIINGEINNNTAAYGGGITSYNGSAITIAQGGVVSSDLPQFSHTWNVSNCRKV